MAPASLYSLNSTKTAIAIILPSTHSSNVNAIRSIHDKAFHKWPAHINILYPSVTADQLETALPLFRAALQQGINTSIRIKADQIGTFRHRHNATIFLQPDDASTEAISALRSKLVAAIGLSDRAGTLDGTFRPHLSLGQASLSGNAVGSLTEKCSSLSGLEWEIDNLAVLTRKPSGEMEVVDHISLCAGDGRKEQTSSVQMLASNENADTVWLPCFAFDLSDGWQVYTQTTTDQPSDERPISILSYNLLSDAFGCSFTPRLPLIIKAIKSTSKHNIDEVLCLQEVSSSMLADLLSDSFKQARYPFASHNTSSLLINHLNLVILSSSSFTFTTHHFDERHKSALVARPSRLPFEMANIHLTAALKDHTVAAKRRQILSLTSFLKQSARKSQRHAIIAGDFNMATSEATIQAAMKKGEISFMTSIVARSLVDPDVWDDVFLISRNDAEVLDDEDGATFDVQRNPLATESNAPADQRPQRYDRILMSKNAPIRTQSFQLFGLPDDHGQCGSDHFGISVVLAPIEVKLSQQTTVTIGRIPVVPINSSDVGICEILKPYEPTSHDEEQRTSAIARLTRILRSDSRLSDILVLPLGSYALGTHFAESDVDTLVIGALPPSAFFQIASSRLRATSEGFQELHYINSLVPVIEVDLLGIKFDIQYCQAPEVLGIQRTAVGTTIDGILTNEQLLRSLHPSALRPLNTYRDSAYLLRTIRCLNAFRTGHRYLSLFLRRRGLYSARFGYLGGVHLSLLLNHVIKRFDITATASIGPESLIATTVNYFASFDWEADTVCDPAFSHAGYKRSSREPVLIFAIHSPTARPNVASSCTRLAAQTLRKEFSAAASRLAAGDWEWMLRGKTSTFHEFTAKFGAFLIISIDMWDLQHFDEVAQRAFFGHVESRMPILLVQLGRIDILYAQAWPFPLSSATDEVEHGKQIKASYLIGVSAPALVDAKERKSMQSKIVQVTRDCETMMRSADCYDEKHIWVQAEVQSRKHIVDLNFSCE